MELQITTFMADGDHREALRLMAEHYAAPVSRFCASMVGSPAEAEELMQETFLDAWNAMPSYRADSNVRAWLYGIARRVCIRHLRRRDRRVGLLQRWLAPQQVAAPPADPTERMDAEKLLRQGLQALKPELRQAVLLRYQVGLDGPEIAVALNIRPATARKRLSLGIQSLRETLRPLLMEPAEPKSQENQDDQKPDSLRAVAGPRIVRP
ncbi:MAG: sigma-70 family RNA polymerase sigma factor [bacterium]